MFERLADLYGSDIMSMLTVQYRMHALIMDWSSKELYNSKVLYIGPKVIGNILFLSNAIGKIGGLLIMT